MKAEFSFKYGESQYTFLAEDGAVYQVDDNVSVRVSRKDYKEYDATEWLLHFENKGEKNSQNFSDIKDCDTLLPLNMPEAKRPGYMPKEGDACVITMNGMVDGSYYWVNDKISAKEYNFNFEYLKATTKTFANVNGRSSDGMMPFFDATANGDGYIAAIGWTGDWKSEFLKCEDGIRIKTGLRFANFYLLPGESLRTSSILLMKYTKDEDKHNKFRRLIKNHFSHKSNTATERESIMGFELWGGLPSEEMKKRLRELKKYDIRFDDIWIDAGWYGDCTKCDEGFSGDWSNKTGDWYVNTRVHPNELKDVNECIKDMGAHLMLWFEPERAVVGTKMIEKHPEWFGVIKNTNFAILNYGNEEAKNYVKKLLLKYIKDLDISCYRQDFNVALTNYFAEQDEENRRGITEIKHITGMYEVWDYLLENAPWLLIDNCSSGGRRIDIESMKRSIPFFRSDYQCNFNENPEVLQTHNANISCYIPYNGCTCKTKSDTYAIRSSYSASWGGAFYNAIFQSMSEEDFLWAKKIIDEYRSIRHYFNKDFYNHGTSSFDNTAWAIFQYHDPDTQSGIVLAFRREQSPFDRVNVTLSGLEMDGKYNYKNLNDYNSFSSTNSLEIVLNEKRSSVIFEYKLAK